MALKTQLSDREYEKFEVGPDGETRVRVTARLDGADVHLESPTGPYRITVVTIADVATNPLPTPLTGRVSLSIRNKSDTVIVYFGNSDVTGDETDTGGWEIGAGEDFNLDLNSDNPFYLIAPAGMNAVVKIFEIASTE